MYPLDQDAGRVAAVLDDLQLLDTLLPVVTHLLVCPVLAVLRSVADPVLVVADAVVADEVIHAAIRYHGQLRPGIAAALVGLVLAVHDSVTDLLPPDTVAAELTFELTHGALGLVMAQARLLVFS